MGSGKHLRYAINKYGLENFSKKVVHVFETETEMNRKEAELVTEEFCLRKDTYNLCPGGRGGFGYINRNPHLNHNEKTRRLRAEWIKEHRPHSFATPESFRTLARKLASRKNLLAGRLRGPLSDEVKKKIGLANKKLVGERNSQYGTIWITNGIENKKIKSFDLDKWLLEGYSRGRNSKV